MFGTFVAVSSSTDGSQLFSQATGKRKAYAIPLEQRIELLIRGGTQFTVSGNRYPLVLDFGKPGRLVINPGHWQQIGIRQAIH